MGVTEQLSLMGLDAVRAPTDRLFFGLFPDPATAQHIARLTRRLQGECGLKGKPLATERFHITLHLVGDFQGLPPGMVAAAREAGAAVAMPPFDLAFDQAGSFAGRQQNRPFVLRGTDGVAALTAFQQTLGKAMAKAGLNVEKSFTPHLTLLYDKHLVPVRPVETVGWTVREFFLIHSLLGKTQYETLGRWPLSA